MRQRTISPGFFTNEVLAGLPPIVRLLFQGLWCLADREGRLEDRPPRIRVLLFPYGTAGPCNYTASNVTPAQRDELSEMLDLLVQAGFIRRYEVDGNSYLAVLNFKKHQHPHPKEAQSVIPPPPKEPCNYKASRVKDMASRAGPSVPSVSSGPSGPSDNSSAGSVVGGPRGETETEPARPPHSGVFAGPEYFPPGHPRRESPPPMTEPEDQGDPQGWIDHDPEDHDQAALVSRVLELERADALADGRAPEREFARNILAAVSATKAGACIDGDLRSVKREWLVASLAACDRFAEENDLTDTSGTAAGG